MKKTIMILLLSLLIGGALAAQSITMTAPKVGEAWLLGSSHAITWTFAGIPETTKVRLVLWRNGAKVGVIAAKVPIGAQGAGSWAWPAVGNYDGGTAAPGSGYEIRIRDVNNQYPFGKSAGPFLIQTLTNAPPLNVFVPSHTVYLNSIAVTKPGQGQAFKPGDELWINWDKAKIASYAQVALEVFTPDKKTKVGQVSGAPGTLFSNTGAFLAYIFVARYKPGQDYIIRIATPDQKYIGWSGVFTVSSQTPVWETVTLKGSHTVSFLATGESSWPGCLNTMGQAANMPPTGYDAVGYDNFFKDPVGPCWTYVGRLYRTIVDPPGIYQGLKVTKAVLRFMVIQGMKQTFYILRRDGASDAFNVPATTVATVAGWGFSSEINVDVTAVVQSWCSGQAKNYGLIIRGFNEGCAHNNDRFRCVITPPELVITKITYK